MFQPLYIFPLLTEYFWNTTGNEIQYACLISTGVYTVRKRGCDNCWSSAILLTHIYISLLCMFARAVKCWVVNANFVTLCLFFAHLAWELYFTSLIVVFSDSADGLCCVLTSPCLSGTTQPPDASLGAPPVVMRRNFDWNKVDRYRWDSNKYFPMEATAKKCVYLNICEPELHKSCPVEEHEQGKTGGKSLSTLF